MGVDASYLYGYGAEINSIDWDLAYLEEKYKEKLDERVNEQYSWTPTWREFIENMKEAVEDDDSHMISEHLESINHLLNLDYGYDGDCYLTFNHKHIAKLYPDTRLKDLDVAAKLYAKT